MEDVKVVILAGGKGTRLRPYTTVFPKPLMPVGEMPILEIVLRQLKHHGIRDITIAVGHLAELIQAFFGNGSKFGLNITYCFEDKPLGTAGSLSLVQDLSENFLVMNGDLLTTLDYGRMVRNHIESGAIATVGVFPREVKIDFGVVELGAGGEIMGYKEKPKLEYMVSMGVNAFNKSVLQFIPRNEYLDIPNLIMKLKNDGKKVMSFRSECEWLDIGRPEDYERAVEMFEKAKARYLWEA